MYSVVKILSLTAAVIGLTAVTSLVSAKDKKCTNKKKNKGKEINNTIGFRSGRELLFNSSPLIYSKQPKVHTGINYSLVLRKPINNRFTVEGGVNYTSFRNIPLYGSSQRFNALSLPMSIDYSFLPHHCIRPYLGAGFQYTLNLVNSRATSPFTSDTYVPATNQVGTGTKYINILFTQGIIFQVNTSIEIEESFHFVPCSINRTIGLNLGVGYHLP